MKKFTPDELDVLNKLADVNFRFLIDPTDDENRGTLIVDARENDRTLALRKQRLALLISALRKYHDMLDDDLNQAGEEAPNEDVIRVEVTDFGGEKEV